MNELITTFELKGDGPTVGRAAIKDSIDIAGMPTRGASAALADATPAAGHAEVVRRLLGAGWDIVGKANMHELAYGMTGVNAWTGTPDNPQDARRIPGGSSSGSAAAVGAGLVDMALGSDTGGSIRFPAACCGVIGLKPTYGRVSRSGAYPKVSSLDCVGPFARSMQTLIAAMTVITPDFDAGAARMDQRRARVGIVTTDSAPQIVAALAAAVRTTGWQTEALNIDGMLAASDAGMVLINAETWAAFGHLVGQGKLGADIEARLGAAGNTTAAQVAHAEQVRREFTAAVDLALLHIDALILPTLPQLPPLLEEVRAGFAIATMSRLVRPFNLSGHPALTMPVPIPGTPLKAGLQIVGRKGDDERICALALHLEHTLR